MPPNVIPGVFMKNESCTNLKLPKPFIVTVSRDDGVWVATCPEIGLVTEADTYEALEDRVFLVAPEICLENHMSEPGEDIFLTLIHEHSTRIAL